MGTSTTPAVAGGKSVAASGAPTAMLFCAPAKSRVIRSAWRRRKSPPNAQDPQKARASIAEKAVKVLAIQPAASWGWEGQRGGNAGVGKGHNEGSGQQ